LIAAAVLIATVFVLSGRLPVRLPRTAPISVRRRAGAGATVRYAGGPKWAGRELQLDAKDASRIEITFSVKSGLPVKRTAT